MSWSSAAVGPRGRRKRADDWMVRQSAAALRYVFPARSAFVFVVDAIFLLLVTPHFRFRFLSILFITIVHRTSPIRTKLATTSTRGSRDSPFPPRKYSVLA